MQGIIHPSNAGDSVAKPFTPLMSQEAPDSARIAYTLEFIASALARIDHSLQVLVHRSTQR